MVVNVLNEVEKTIDEMDAFKEALKSPKFCVLYIGGSLLLLFGITIIPLLLDFNNEWIILSLAIAIASIFGIFYSWINPYMKRLIREKYDVESNPDWKIHWANEEFDNEKMIKLIERLFSKTILIEGNNKFNAERALRISNTLRDAAKCCNFIEPVKVYFGTIFTMYLFIWAEIVSDIFRNNNEYALQLSFKYLFLVAYIALFLSLVYHYILKKLIESRKAKLLRMAKKMENLSFHFEYKSKLEG